ncbi:MAG: hypothetical protein JNL89_03205 [Rhodanobacteraceae bacterium]|nr:hypothetical protein [Rhodanobacteraceae bacterium]
MTNPFPSSREIERRLLSNDPDAEKIRAWFTKHPLPPTRNLTEQELAILLLVSAIDTCRPLSKWEKATARERTAHAAAVARLASALAELIESDCRPFYPPALELFDESQANRIVSEFAPASRDLLRAGTRFDERGPSLFETATGNPVFMSVARHLADAFYRINDPPQSVADLLRNLATWSQREAREANEKPRARRPQTGDANRRVLAVHLASHFQRLYRLSPNEVIACCVNLVYPEAYPPATEDEVRTWRGVR